MSDIAHGCVTISANEFLALKDECASLRKRIQAIEAEMKMYLKLFSHLIDCTSKA